VTPIPLVDLRRQWEQIREEVESGWADVVARSEFVLGRQVREFEAAFASFCEAEYCIGVANGTDAIELALRGADMGPGDEVIVPANTFIATALAALRAGTALRLVDCDPDTYLIDPAAVLEVCSGKTKAVIPVHLFGQMAPCEELAKAVPDLVMIEDAAQAQGARHRGRAIGSFGVAAATSFFPGKNLGAYGDAGAILTNDSLLAARLSRLRNWGSGEKYHHPEVGFNSRLDTLQAVVLSAKLARLTEWNQERVKAAANYDQLIGGRAKLPSVLAGNEHVFHIYAIEIDSRDTVMRRMQEDGIGVGVHYPVPIHLQGALAHLGHQPGDFPNAERAAKRMLSLPIFPGITEAEQEQVVASLFRAMQVR
jgi:dTDP-4-amino-4,6-dideoxygalactose transaminase